MVYTGGHQIVARGEKLYPVTELKFLFLIENLEKRFLLVFILLPTNLL